MRRLCPAAKHVVSELAASAQPARPPPPPRTPHRPNAHDDDELAKRGQRALDWAHDTAEKGLDWLVRAGERIATPGRDGVGAPLPPPPPRGLGSPAARTKSHSESPQPGMELKGLGDKRRGSSPRTFSDLPPAPGEVRLLDRRSALRATAGLEFNAEAPPPPDDLELSSNDEAEGVVGEDRPSPTSRDRAPTVEGVVDGPPAPRVAAEVADERLWLLGRGRPRVDERPWEALDEGVAPAFRVSARPLPGGGSGAGARVLAVDASESTVLAGGRDGVVRVWSLRRHPPEVKTTHERPGRKSKRAAFRGIRGTAAAATWTGSAETSRRGHSAEETNPRPATRTVSAETSRGPSDAETFRGDDESRPRRGRFPRRRASQVRRPRRPVARRPEPLLLGRRRRGSGSGELRRCFFRRVGRGALRDHSAVGVARRVHQPGTREAHRGRGAGAVGVRPRRRRICGRPRAVRAAAFGAGGARGVRRRREGGAPRRGVAAALRRVGRGVSGAAARRRGARARLFHRRPGPPTRAEICTRCFPR